MTHVFVSYKRESLDVVEKLVNELKRHHYVWFDQTGIPGGTEWEQMINNALDAASALVLMVTPAALESEWVTYEYQTALKKNVLVIPFILETTTLPSDLRGRQTIIANSTNAFEDLMDSLPGVSRIWGDQIVSDSELDPQRTFAELAEANSDICLYPSSKLVGIPIKQTRYCRVYLVGKKNDTLEPLNDFQVALQLTTRNFGLQRLVDASYPHDDFVRDVAAHFLVSPSRQIRLYLVRGPLNQPYDQLDRLGLGLNVARESEWKDVVQAADYARSISKGRKMQLFVNGPAIMTYRLGNSNPGFYRYELYQYDYNERDYRCVLSG